MCAHDSFNGSHQMALMNRVSSRMSGKGTPFVRAIQELSHLRISFSELDSGACLPRSYELRRDQAELSEDLVEQAESRRD